jgi:chaperonin GroEL
LLWASKHLSAIKDKCSNFDQKIGVEIIERACCAPVKAISNNAGEEGSVVVREVLKNTTHEIGFNAQVTSILISDATIYSIYLFLKNE